MLWLALTGAPAAFASSVNPTECGVALAPKAASFEQTVAQILHSSPILWATSAGRGMTSPLIVTFKNDLRAVKKKDFPELSSRAYAEVAAYRLDALLGHANHVPITTLREDRGALYSMQLFIGDTRNSTELEIANSDDLKLFDYLIDNTDRRADNLLVKKSGETVAIDNALGFNKEYARRLGIGESKSWSIQLTRCCSVPMTPWILKPMAKAHFAKMFKRGLPKSFFILRALTEAQITAAMKDVLPDVELANLLKRRRFLLENVDE